MKRILTLNLLFLLLFTPLVLAQPESQYFDSAGVKIHYTVQGEGEPVVLIHGFTASAQTNFGNPGVIDKLAQHFKVIAIDNRGHGKSDKPHGKENYGVKMTEDIIRLLDHLKIPKAHLVGYSMGGFMTLNLVANHPERIISAVTGGAGWRNPNAPRDTVLDRLAESLEAGNGIGPLIEALRPADAPPTTPESIQATNTMLMAQNDPIALASVARGIQDLTVTEAQLKANKVPTLAVIGARDPLKAGVDAMQGVMANLEVVVIDGADHMTAFSNPLFPESIIKFIKAHAAQK